MKYPYLLSALLLLFFLIHTGCSSTGDVAKNTEMLQQNTALQQKNAEITAELTARNALTATLQAQLLEKNAEIDKLKARQKGLGKEVARGKTKMRVPESKAEAVTVLAEVETDINTANERVTGNDRLPSFDKADQLMAESKAQLDQGHYDRATSLAGEALEIIQAMELKTETGAKAQKSPAGRLVFPLVMQLSRKSAVREYPRANARLLHVLEKGTKVTATGYEKSWLRITTNTGQHGWIPYSRLKPPDI